MNQKDILSGVQGNATCKGFSKPKNKAGKTDPESKNAGKTLPTKRVIQKGWSK
jgi:hypothetical protein